MLRPSMMTAVERRLGRFLRAPDHTAGDGSPGGGGQATETVAEATSEAADPVPPTEDGGDGDATVLGGDAAGKEAAAPENVAPEAYDLKAPEGMALDADALAIAEPVLRELNLTNDQAQKLTDAYAQIMPKVAERYQAEQATAITQQRAAWVAEAKADPEIGGANWDKSIAASAKALDRFGAPAGSPFRELLNVSGLGNHPEMIRIFANIGKAVGEDADFVSARATSARSREDKYYGS